MGPIKKSFQLIPYGQKWVHIIIQVIFNILYCKWYLKTSFCISKKVGRAWLCLTIDSTIPSGNIPDIEPSNLIARKHEVNKIVSIHPASFEMF